MDIGAAGRIMLINGTSSSGKSSIISAVRSQATELWLEMGIDRFAYALPDRVDGHPTWPMLFPYVHHGDGSGGPFTIETTDLGRRFITGMHRSVASVAGTGMNVIVDHVILERSWVEEITSAWAAFDVLRVGVRCPLDVVIERERARANRTIGQAEAQFDVVHRWVTYDIEVDTSILTPEEAAAQILDALSVTDDPASREM